MGNPESLIAICVHDLLVRKLVLYVDLVFTCRREYRRIPKILVLVKWTYRGVHADRTLHVLDLRSVGATRIILHGVTAIARDYVLGLNPYNLSSISGYIIRRLVLGHL